MLLLTLLACTPDEQPEQQPDDEKTTVVADNCAHPLVEDLLPFPSNTLVTRDATSPTGVRVDLTGVAMPQTQDGVDAVDGSLLTGQDGFSRLAPVVVGFDAAVDPGNFPEEGEESIDASNPAYILEVETGTVVPSRASLAFDGLTLTLWPDRPLAAGALHAIVLRESLQVGDCFSAGPSVAAIEGVDDELGQEFAAARAAAEAGGEAIAVAFPFTTRSAEGEAPTLPALEAQVPGLLGDDDLAWDVLYDCSVEGGDYCAEGVAFAGTGVATLPAWRKDGVFVTDADGVPTVQGTEDVHFWLLAPEGARTAPAPLLVLQHGLGGKKEDMLALGQELAAEGWVVVALDAVLHGARAQGGDTTMAFFGIEIDQWHVEVARDNARQTAADHLALRTLLQGATFEGFSIDPDEAAYVGQSLGAIIGSTTCALDSGFDRCVLNVPGGRLVEIVRANDTYSALMNLYFDRESQFREVELFSALSQGIVDPGDPALNAPRILEDGRAVLVQYATNDDTVANQTTAVMARAMGIPVLDPSYEEISGLTHEDMPVSDNVGTDKGMVTAGLAQFQDSHGFLTGGSEEAERAVNQVVEFLREGVIEEGN